MDNKTAAILLASMLERIERDQTLGSVSSLERQAMLLALQALGYEDTPATLATQNAGSHTGANTDAKSATHADTATPP